MFKDTPEGKAYRESLNARMRARQKSFTAYRARRQSPLSFGEALSQLYIANARHFGVSLDDTYEGLCELVPHMREISTGP